MDFIYIGQNELSSKYVSSNYPVSTFPVISSNENLFSKFLREEDKFLLI